MSIETFFISSLSQYVILKKKKKEIRLNYYEMCDEFFKIFNIRQVLFLGLSLKFKFLTFNS